MESNDKNASRNLRIGALVAGALLAAMIFLFFIGSEQKLFARKTEYEVKLSNVTGLAEGNPVKLSGVTIGVVKEIRLPESPKENIVDISLMIDRKFAARIRSDSRARLKKLGLLAGDSFVDITPGSPNFPELEAGSIIPSQRATDVDALIASGGDLVENLVTLSYSLKNILARVDKGEGLLGELTTSSTTKQRLTDALLLTLNRTNALLDHVQSGKGLVGKMVYDDAYANQVSASINGSIASLQSVMGSVQRSFESGSGILPTLLNDPEGKKQVVALVENLRLTSERMAGFSQGLAEGQGLVPRLINDKEFGDQTLQEFRLLVHELNETARKLNTGEGTAGKLIADPSVYESINDILIGINESKMLRWLIRNRQGAGIEKRYDVEKKAAPADSSSKGSPRKTKSATPPPSDSTTATPSPGLEVAPVTTPQSAPETGQTTPATTTQTGTVTPVAPVVPPKP